MNTVELLIAMDEGGLCDALILQRKVEGSNGAPDVLNARAIIRRIRTPAGIQWAFHSLWFGRAGSGTYGDVDTILQAVERSQRGVEEHYEWIQIDYCDPLFPIHLIPWELT